MTLCPSSWSCFTSLAEPARSRDAGASLSELPWVLPTVRTRLWRETQALGTSESQWLIKLPELRDTAGRDSAARGEMHSRQLSALSLCSSHLQVPEGRILQPPSPLLKASTDQETLPGSPDLWGRLCSAESFTFYELSCSGAMKHSEEPGPVTPLQKAQDPSPKLQA